MVKAEVLESVEEGKYRDRRGRSEVNREVWRVYKTVNTG